MAESPEQPLLVLFSLPSAQTSEQVVMVVLVVVVMLGLDVVQTATVRVLEHDCIKRKQDYIYKKALHAVVNWSRSLKVTIVTSCIRMQHRHFAFASIAHRIASTHNL